MIPGRGRGARPHSRSARTRGFVQILRVAVTVTRRDGHGHRPSPPGDCQPESESPGRSLTQSLITQRPGPAGAAGAAGGLTGHRHGVFNRHSQSR